MIQLIVAQIMAFVGLVALLRWLFYRNVHSAVQRMDLIQLENLKREAELKQRLNRVEAECKTKLQEVQAQAQKVLEDAKEQAGQVREEMVKEARRESERIIQEAQERRDEIRQELERETGHKAVQLASDAIRYVMTTQLEEKIHEHLVEDLLKELGSLDPGRLQTRSDKAHVVTPLALTLPQRNRLQEILARKAGHPVTVSESVDPKVIAGIVVQLDSLVLDGSLRNKLKEAVAYVRKGN